MSSQPTNNKTVKVPFYLEAGKEITEIELENGGSNGYKGQWWKKIPDSPDIGTTKYEITRNGYRHNEAYTDKPYYPKHKDSDD